MDASEFVNILSIQCRSVSEYTVDSYLKKHIKLNIFSFGQFDPVLDKSNRTSGDTQLVCVGVCTRSDIDTGTSKTTKRSAKVSGENEV